MNSYPSHFMPPPGMSNPHVQTVLSSMGRKIWRVPGHNQFQAAGTRELIDLAGVKLAVDLNLQPGQPLVTIIPGWLGSSSSSYVLSTGHALHDAGFSVARVNLRDHGDTAHLNQGMFNSALIDEVVGLVALLNERHHPAESSAPQGGLLGFSLGGNFTLRVARALPELSALAVCPAIEPADTMYSIDRNLIYQRYFVRKWRQVWLEKQRAFPNEYQFGDALSLNTVSALTDYFVRYHSDFSSTAEYFSAYDLSADALSGVNAHILAAEDDPIIPSQQYLALPDSLQLQLTPRGGHGAYLDSWGLTSWVDEYAVHHFQQRLNTGG